MNYLELSEKIENMFLASNGPVVSIDITADDFDGMKAVLDAIGDPDISIAVNMPEPLKVDPNYMSLGIGGALDHIALVKGSTGAAVLCHDIFGGTGVYLLDKLSTLPKDLLAFLQQYVDTWDVPEFTDGSVTVQ